ncbi:MAG: CRTAC1 family protein [Pseudomonadota bacterium]
MASLSHGLTWLCACALCNTVYGNALYAAEPLFVPVVDDPSTVDGGLSRGVAFGDLDSDGSPDLVVTNTINYPEFIYRNDRGRFVQVMETAPSLAGGFSEGVNLIDIDNDADLDIFVARTDRPNSLYRNDGDWIFAELDAGDLTADASSSSMACWFDVNKDGWLDAFVVNRHGEHDALYLNRRGKSFDRVVDGSLVTSGGDGRTCTAADFNGDGNTDVFVGNFIDASLPKPMRQENRLFLSRGHGNFERVELSPAVTEKALTYGSSAADVDNDGDLDLLVTNIGIGDQNRLYLNDGSANFTVHTTAGLDTSDDTPSKGHVWGDFDHDGDLDLAIANGTEGSENISNLLYLNDGHANFEAAQEEAFVHERSISAGIAAADIDSDGDLDLFVANWANGDEDNALYIGRGGGAWLKVTLVGTQSNRMGVGARVSVTVKEPQGVRRQHRWVQSQTGYASQSEAALHFGLGAAHTVHDLSILWPSGQSDAYSDIRANKHLTFVEGAAKPEKPNPSVRPINEGTK